MSAFEAHGPLKATSSTLTAAATSGSDHLFDTSIGLRQLAPPAIVFVLSRLFLTFLAARASSILAHPRIHGNASVLPRHDLLAHIWSWASPWFRFDAKWYVGIAEHGYHWGGLGAANTNFMPLYPALIRLVTPFAGGSAWLASWIVANLASLVATCLFWIWVEHRWDRGVALRSTLLLSSFPFAFFFGAPYAEPLFLALAVSAFLLAEHGHWYGAAACAGLCTITRPVGLAVVVALVILAANRKQTRSMAISCASSLPLIGFAGYLAVAFGHPLGFMTYHTSGWVAPRGGLVDTLAAQFNTQLTPFDRVDAALAMLFLASAFLVWRRVGVSYAAFVAAGAMLPLLHGLAGMERYVIVLFPVFAAWATVGGRRTQAVLFGASLLGLTLGATMFFAGYTLT